MKRWLSITAICALLVSPAAPLVAASCPHAKMAKACHRVKRAHHCDMMETQESSSSAEEPAQQVIENGSTTQDCPMDCCSPGQLSSAAAIPAMILASPVLVSGYSLPFTPTVFCTPGFSSHTDRGPPTA